MRHLAILCGTLPVLLLLYLLAWPVPVEPVAWTPPPDHGLTGAYTPNDILAHARAVNLDGFHGPENIARGADGALYAGVREGRVLRLPERGGKPQVFATTGGRPLGVAVDADGSLVVANAFLGIQRVTTDGSVSTLTDAVNGQPLRYVNDVAIGANGTIYFTEASTKFGAEPSGGTLEASLLDLLEHGGHGLVLAYDPAMRTTRVLIDGLEFANGIAIDHDQRYLVIAETGRYRLLKHWLQGEAAGTTEVLVDNLPGFPDNVDTGFNGRYWVGLVAPRSALLDRYAPHPGMRKLLSRLPKAFRPRPVAMSHVIAINGEGEVLMNLQDPAARHPLLTGVLELRDRLYLTTLDGPVLPYIEKTDLL